MREKAEAAGGGRVAGTGPLVDIIAGARPNFMKVAPIIQAIRARQAAGSALRYRLVHTGQHYDAAMSGSFFEQLGIPEPDVDLEVGSGSQAQQTAHIMLRYEQVLVAAPSALCLVVGDVNSTLACALTAQKMQIPVAHVEGGIRSGDWSMPEEINRLATDAVSNWFFTTSEVANANLNRPGRYPLESADTRLSELLAIAGGTSLNGADVVVLSGTREGKPYRVEIDVPALFARGSRGDDPIVVNGDTIWVERQPLVYIYGEVQRPGSLRLERSMTLIQTLAAGGGLTQRGTERGIRVHRRGPDGRAQVLQPAMDDQLLDGDVVYVRESLF